LSTEASLEAQFGHCVSELKGIVARREKERKREREKEKRRFWSRNFSGSDRLHILGLRSDNGSGRGNRERIPSVSRVG
jgi:hypothetical protein